MLNSKRGEQEWLCSANQLPLLSAAKMQSFRDKYMTE